MHKIIHLVSEAGLLLSLLLVNWKEFLSVSLTVIHLNTEHDSSCFGTWSFVITIIMTVIEPRDIFITVTVRNSFLLKNYFGVTCYLNRAVAFGYYLLFETAFLKYRNILSAFEKLRKSTIFFVIPACPSVCLYAWNKSASTGRILMEFDVRDFSKIWRKNPILIKIWQE